MRREGATKVRLTGDSYRSSRGCLPGDGEVTALAGCGRRDREASVEGVVEVGEASCASCVLVGDFDDLRDPASIRSVDAVLEEGDELDALSER